LSDYKGNLWNEASNYNT